MTNTNFKVGDEIELTETNRGHFSSGFKVGDKFIIEKVGNDYGVKDVVFVVKTEYTRSVHQDRTPCFGFAEIKLTELFDSSFRESVLDIKKEFIEQIVNKVSELKLQMKDKESAVAMAEEILINNVINIIRNI